MATDKQRVHRNNELRKTVMVMGELDSSDGILATTDYAICSIPDNVYVTNLYIRNTTGAEQTIDTTAGSTISVLDNVVADGAVDVTAVGAYATVGSQVIVNLSAAITEGRLQVGVEYIAFDTVNGDRVRAR